MSSGHRVRLGRTELKVSPICYGTWQLSPRFWGPPDQQQISAAIGRAFELGINFYDTADAYGEGLAEEVLGGAISSLPRDQLIIATKVFWRWLSEERRFPDLSRDYIIPQCEASLRRLKLDHIDLYQCHGFDQLTDIAEVIDAMETLLKQGKIRAYGTSNWTVEQMRLGNSIGHFASCQPPYSLLNREIEKDILPYCRASDIGTLVYSPLHKGLLTGKYTGNETFTDFRKDSNDFKGERFQKLCQQVAKAGEIARRYDMTTVQLMLTATLMHPSIDCAIVGIKTVPQIEEAAGAMGKSISREDWHALRSLLAG